MKTKALRLYGKEDLRLEAFDLPPIGPEELLVKVVADSLCMSSYKAAMQGAAHKRVPDDVAENPIVLGHELSGEILQVGDALQGRYTPGSRFTLQPAMQGTYRAAGYSYANLGGDMQYAIIPREYIEQDCVLPYAGDAWFAAALAEPLSCVLGAARASYHTEQGSYVHQMGIRPGGKMALLAGVGPMGLAMIDSILHGERRPSLLVVTDIDEDRLARAAQLLTVQDAREHGVELVYLNTGEGGDPVQALRTRAGGGYDDVFVFAPVAAVIEQADAILGYDGCLNFFAGPSDTAFSARLNFYNVHYNAAHIAGTSGGNTDDIRQALELASAGRVNPAILVTHIGGLDAAKDATLRLPSIPGGKKMIYTHISMPLTAIADFDTLGGDNPLFASLASICAKHDGLWNAEAERYLLQNAPPI